MGKLIVLEKYPRVRPAGIWDMVQRLIDKDVLDVVDEEATHACGK